MLHIPVSRVFCLTLLFMDCTDLGESNNIVLLLLTAASYPPTSDPGPQPSESCNQMKSSEHDGKLQGSFCLVGKNGLSGPKGDGTVGLGPPWGVEVAHDIKGWFQNQEVCTDAVSLNFV